MKWIFGGICRRRRKKPESWSGLEYKRYVTFIVSHKCELSFNQWRSSTYAFFLFSMSKLSLVVHELTILLSIVWPPSPMVPRLYTKVNTAFPPRSKTAAQLTCYTPPTVHKLWNLSPNSLKLRGYCVKKALVSKPWSVDPKWLWMVLDLWDLYYRCWLSTSVPSSSSLWLDKLSQFRDTFHRLPSIISVTTM